MNRSCFAIYPHLFHVWYIHSFRLKGEGMTRAMRKRWDKQAAVLLAAEATLTRQTKITIALVVTYLTLVAVMLLWMRG